MTCSEMHYLMIFLFTVNYIQILKHKSPIFTIKTGQFDSQAVLQLHFDVLASRFESCYSEQRRTAQSHPAVG